MKILTFTSGKGGVGKTTISLNAARQLSLHGSRVLVVDFDIHNKGVTSLFLPKVSDETWSVLGVAERCKSFDVSLAKELAQRTEPAMLDEAGNLLLLPAVQPTQLIRWETFVAPNADIVAFFRAYFSELASEHGIDFVVIDCYGGIDTMTVAAIGVADDTVIVNEPDVITFTGTLLLYKHIGEVYGEEERKPRVHFVINRVTSRHSFRGLEDEYRKHLAPLAFSGQILTYLPFDKLVLETFGDYPFFTELMPRGLITRKIQLMLRKILPDENLGTLPDFSGRRMRRLRKSTSEAPFSEPERIIRLATTAPFWILMPAALLWLLTLGGGLIVHYRVVQATWLVALIGLAFIATLIGVVAPLQMSRFLLRTARYERRKRRLEGRGMSPAGILRTLLGYLRVAVPAVFAVGFAAMLGLQALDLGRPFILRNLSLWPGTLYGFAKGGDYSRLRLRDGATIRAGSQMSRARLRYAKLSGVTLSELDLSDADLSHARLDRASLWGTNLNGASLVGASLDSAYLQQASLEEARLGEASLDRAGLDGAVLTGAQLQGASLGLATLTDANLDDANLAGATLWATPLEGASLQEAKLHGATLKEVFFFPPLLTGLEAPGVNLQRVAMPRVQLQGADLQGANLNLAELTGSDLTKAHLARVSAQGAFLAGAMLRDAELDETDLREADLRGADFGGARISQVEWEGAVLRDADLQGAIFQEGGENDRALSYAARAGARLSPEQKVRAAAFEKPYLDRESKPEGGCTSRRASMVWLHCEWKAPDVEWQREAESMKRSDEVWVRYSATRAAATADLVEHALVSQDLDTASQRLAELRELDAPRERGKTHMLSVLLRIAENQPIEEPLEEWCDWLGENQRLDNWRWKYWNASFARRDYTADQLRLAFALQLTAEGAIKCERLGELARRSDFGG